MAVFAVRLLLQSGDGFPAQLWSALSRNQVLLLPIIALAIAYAVRRVRQPTMGSVMPESAAPSGITPAESGVLLHGSVSSREVAATLVDLSIKKYLSIVDAAPEMRAPAGEHDLVFRTLRPETEWQNLAAHEKTLLRQAFRDQEWTRLSYLRQLVPDVVPAFQAQIKNSLWERGMLRTDPNNAGTPRWKSFVYVASLMGMLDGLVAGQTGLGLHLYEHPGLAFLMIALTMGIVVWAVQDPTNSTRQGFQVQTYLEGLRQFIQAVDADRLQRLERYRFDELLPYAMVFGIEQKWVEALRQLSVQPLNLVGNDWAGKDWVGSNRAGSEEVDSLLRGGRLTLLSAYLQPAGSKQ
jgi:hypothetical protein